MPLLSVVIPAYNEAGTIRQLIEKVNAVGLDKEVVVIDNGSTDGTDKILRQINLPNLKVVHHLVNRGKGGGVLTGIAHAEGEFVVIQDADLEYDPNDFLKLMEAIRTANADLALGCRFTKGYHGLFLHRMGNKFLTRLLNRLFGAKFNDYATCYKLARTDVFRNLGLKANGFEIEIEILCNALKKKLKIIEVPVSYHPRSYQQGKKIRWIDGLWAVFYIIKYRFFGG